MTDRVIVVGASHGGAQAVASLRDGGFEGEIVLIGDEIRPPYHRPPLSKAYLKEPSEGISPLRGESYYAEQSIELRLGETVTAIDPSTKTVTLASGDALEYGSLILSLGARVRKPNMAGADAEGVFYMRTADDSDALRASLDGSETIVVVGGGFIGLEAAATARQLGKSVIVLEAADRLMGRAVAPAISDYFAEQHRAAGIDIRLSTPLKAIRTDGHRATGVEFGEGEIVDAATILIGIGVIPNVELAEAAGLSCSNGIAVDAFTRTSDPSIYAIGDCANFTFFKSGQPIRLESVQNATDQARVAAAAILGKDQPYEEAPWFWSDQADLKLQMAGLGAGADRYVLRGDPADGKFSVAHVADDQIIAVDSVDAAGDHMVFRKLLGGDELPTPDNMADTDFDLRAFFKAVQKKARGG